MYKGLLNGGGNIVTSIACTCQFLFSQE